MAKRKLNFIELLELLEDADAIMFDGTVTYPAVDTDEEYFGIDIDGDGDQVNYYEDDIDSIIINDAGLIEFTKGTDTYVISILDVKELD
jgi:hypothetical protein